MAKKHKNRFTTPTNPLKALLMFPVGARGLVQLPKNINLPVEVVIAMGQIASIIYYHRCHPKSPHYRAAMLVHSVTYDYIDKKRPLVKDGWVSVNYLKGKTSLRIKTAYISVLERQFKWANKTYEWSGLMMGSAVPGCDSRFAIGPRSKLYGSGNRPFSTGSSYKNSLTFLF